MSSLVQIPIQRIYYDALEVALQAQVKRLARDIATTLREPEQPFLKYLASQKIGAYLFEEEGSELVDIQTMRCSSYVASSQNPSILVKCNEPVLLGANLGTKQKTACPFHCAHPQPAPSTALKTYRLVDGLYWLDEDNVLYTLDLQPCGRYESDTKVCRKFVKIEEIVSHPSNTSSNVGPTNTISHGSASQQQQPPTEEKAAKKGKKSKT